MTLARGVDEKAYLYEQSVRQQAGRLRTVYENHEFNIPTQTAGDPLETVVNHSTQCSCGTGAFLLLTRVQRVVVSNLGDVLCKVAFNASSNHQVTVYDGETLDWDYVEVSGLWLWNPSTTDPVSVRVVLC